MCDLCGKYGDPNIEGGRWYLNPKNFARPMYTLKMPGTTPKGFRQDVGRTGPTYNDLIDAIEANDQPRYNQLRVELQANMDKAAISGGQVVTLKESDRVLELCSPLGLMHCMCRARVRGMVERNENEYTCLGPGEGMLKWERWPENWKGGVKFVTVDEAIEWNHRMDKRGFVHYVMFYDTPYIGGYCQ